MKTKLAALQSEITALIKKHGFEVTKNRGRFSPTDFTLSIGAHLAGVNEDMTTEARTFKAYCRVHGIPETVLGVVIKSGTLRNMKIVGYNPRARKNCILLQRIDGKRFHCSADVVTNAMRLGYLSVA